MSVIHGAPYSYYSNIKDHWSHINITNIMTMKMFEILLELSKLDTETKWVNAVGKMVLIDLLNMGGCHKPSICKKKKNLWCAIKWSIACT